MIDVVFQYHVDPPRIFTEGTSCARAKEVKRMKEVSMWGSRRFMKCEVREDKEKESLPSAFFPLDLAQQFSSIAETSRKRLSATSGIMEALLDADDIIIGVHGIEAVEMEDLVEKVARGAHRESLFDMVIRVSVAAMKPALKSNNLFYKIFRVMRVGRRPDLEERIQAELADALGFTMNEKSEAKRAEVLRERIKMEQKILLVLQDLNQSFDLCRLGIPFGDDHTGCKILLTSSSSPEILSNQMHARKVFEARFC